MPLLVHQFDKLLHRHRCLCICMCACVLQQIAQQLAEADGVVGLGQPGGTKAAWEQPEPGAAEAAASPQVGRELLLQMSGLGCSHCAGPGGPAVTAAGCRQVYCGTCALAAAAQHCQAMLLPAVQQMCCWCTYAASISMLCVNMPSLPAT